MIIREYFSPKEAGARIGIVITATMVGMALGGWMSGVILLGGFVPYGVPQWHRVEPREHGHRSAAAEQKQETGKSRGWSIVSGDARESNERVVTGPRGNPQWRKRHDHIKIAPPLSRGRFRIDRVRLRRCSLACAGAEHDRVARLLVAYRRPEFRALHLVPAFRRQFEIDRKSVV